MRQMKLNNFPQGQITSKLESWDSNLDSLLPEPS